MIVVSGGKYAVRLSSRCHIAPAGIETKDASSSCPYVYSAPTSDTCLPARFVTFIGCQGLFVSKRLFLDSTEKLDVLLFSTVISTIPSPSLPVCKMLPKSCCALTVGWRRKDVNRALRMEAVEQCMFEVKLLGIGNLIYSSKELHRIYILIAKG